MTFTKALIFYHFDPKNYIQIKTDVLKDNISKVFSQLTSNQQSSNYIILKISGSNFSKSKNSQ